jgi:hypothetical protein
MSGSRGESSSILAFGSIQADTDAQIVPPLIVGYPGPLAAKQTLNMEIVIPSTLPTASAVSHPDLLFAP